MGKNSGERCRYTHGGARGPGGRVFPPARSFLAATLPCFCVCGLLNFDWPVMFAFRRPRFSAASFALVAFSADDLNIV
nr:MAG TPA: hypothetical protein [Caudoviricetes sp.]